jgi:hypothetical protein
MAINREKRMSVKVRTSLSLGVVGLATLLCALPVSVGSAPESGKLSLRVDTAAADGMSVRSRRVRHVAYGRLYDWRCGGPYVGGGWNGGTYWGGPWMDLSCYPWVAF